MCLGIDFLKSEEEVFWLIGKVPWKLVRLSEVCTGSEDEDRTRVENRLQNHMDNHPEHHLEKHLEHLTIVGIGRRPPGDSNLPLIGPSASLATAISALHALLKRIFV